MPGNTSTISAGQSSSSLTVVQGETLIVNSGGKIVSALVDNGGSAVISAGGADSSTTILAGGSETVLGTTSGDQIYGGQLTSSGGVAVLTGETVFNGGSILVANGDTATGTVVSSGGVLNVSGKGFASNTVLVSGGALVFESPKAIASGTLTFSGGGNTLLVSVLSSTGSSGLGDQATISGFGTTDVIDITGIASSSVASFTVTTSGGNTVAAISSGGSAVETFIFAGTTTYNGGSLSLVADSGGDAEIVYTSVTSVTTPTGSGVYTEGFRDELLVLNGGGVSAATIGSGGSLVLSAGVDNAAVISAGGVETLAASGAATGDTILGSAVVNGALAQLVSGVVSSGGVVDLYQGAASGVTVDNGGKLYISGGNTASNTVLNGGATVELATSGAKLGGGALTFANGGNTLQYDKLLSANAGALATISGFSSTDTIVLSGLGAGAAVSVATSGGNDVATVSGANGTETLIFAGTATYTNNTLFLVSSGGAVDLEYNPNPTTLTVSGGVTSTALTVSAGVTLNVLSGGTASATTVDNLGIENVSGADVSAAVSKGGTETVFVGGSATGGQIAGTAVIDGAASNETVLSGGAFSVTGGVNSSATVSAGGSATVTNSGMTSGDQIYGHVIVSGGSAIMETVLAGGLLAISGGANSSATIDAGGSATVTNSGTMSGDQIYGGVGVTGGTVTGETVQGGGLLTIGVGVDSSTTILAGGNETVLGSASGDQIYGTQLVSAATAVVTGETVFAGGNLDLFLKGAVASGTVVSSGGALNVSGNATASNTVLSGGGLIDLQSPKANVTGSLTFAGGGNTLEIADLTSGGFGVSAIISGFSSTDRIDITSGAYTGSALTLSQTVSGGNTIVEVISGGSTIVETFTFAGTTLDGYLGFVSDGNGGVDLETPPVSVTTSVTTPTASGAFTEDATDTLLVLGGGVVSAATIDAGGFLIVNGGADNAATVLAGGTETISAGSAAGDQIYGSAIVDGGAVTGATALSGGNLSIGAGASASNVVLGGGGVVDLASPTAALSGSLTFTSGFNTLEAGAIASAGDGDQAVISGFSTADKIDVTGISPTSATLSFATNGAGDSVATISGTGGSESFVFSDPSTYNSGTMSLLSDGSGGVDLVLDTTPVVSFTSLGLETNAATEIVNGTVNVAVDPEAVGTTVSVSEGNAVVGTATVGANGYWSAKVTFQNDDGANVLTASDTDAAGNTGVTSQSLTYNVDTTAAAFTPGNLVISISGDGDGSGAYGDNQASTATLEQITTSGTIVSQIVLPQTATVVNGVTEYAFSSEYGSSSEGSLELSADGHSLVIAGYGVNANTFNAGGSGVYGTSALAQSTSVPGGSHTAVARVIADITADGAVDTSTALYNVFNLNNPRSVATVDGSSFYVSGQGDKNPTDMEQGVYYALDGASSATVINQATDTRAAEIYNGELYVSVDSTQGGGTTNISEYSQNGSLPTSATSPVVLTGISNSVILTSATANGVNNADIGSSVNLSPENFFFANADTLYVADGGAPKEGGLGDGGLQKWVYNSQTSSWTLEYTLSTGLGLVANTAGAASSGDTGLIGLTGEVVGGSVELYATTEPLNDLGATSVVTITDQLSSTTGAGESFTTVLTASPGENIRGIAFAPTAYAPTITGTVAGQTTSAEASVTPFSHVTIADQNAQATETLTITVGGSGGTLSGTGLSGGTNGVYTLSGSATTVTGELDALSFTPTAGQPSTTSTSTFTLSDLSSADSTPTVDASTTVIDSDGPSAPAITTLVGQPVNGSTIEVEGTGMSGDTVTLYADGGATAVGTGTVVNGAFDITTSATFADGDHTLTATETDSASLTSTASAGFAVAVDPTAPAITTLVGQPVNGGTIEVKGAGETGDTVTLYADGGATAVGSGTVVNGKFDITTTATFAAGHHTLTATETDPAGLTSAAGAAFTVSVADVLTTAKDTVVGGAAGVEIIAASGTLSSGDVISPTAGQNIIQLSGGGKFDLRSPKTVTNITELDAAEGAGAAFETLYLRNGLNLTVNVASSSAPGAGIEIYGENDSSVINLGSGADTVILGSANETVNGGAGNETFSVKASTVGATIHGGSGRNTLIVTNGGTVAMGSNITGVQSVILNTATDFTANTLNLTITGHGHNTITAGSGTETITGGGNDVLVAGSGADTFKDVSAHLETDTIENFATGDTIDITNLNPSSTKPTTAMWSDGELKVTQASKTITIALPGDFTGHFTVSSDGAKGTDITYGAAAPAPTADPTLDRLIEAMASFGGSSANALTLTNSGADFAAQHILLAAHS